MASNPRPDPVSSSPELSMSERFALHDWSSTPLGPMKDWPEALKVAYQIMISSRFPMVIWWGPELINLYNDAYAPMLGKKHPTGFARPAAEIWREIWDVVGTQTELVLKHHQSTWNEEVLLAMERYGYTEETYFTWSYSPIGAGNESAAGLFCAVTEETFKVIGRRRLRTLRELGSETADLRSSSEAFAAAVEILHRNPYDIPFALLYRTDAEGKRAMLAGVAGVEKTSGTPLEIGLDPESNPWGLDLCSQEVQVVTNLEKFFTEIPKGPWPIPPSQAIVLPFPKGSENQAAGFMIAGISSYRRLDDDYRGFLTLVASHIATAVSNSRAYEAERRRAEALAEIDRAKTTFFSNVSHEFRTPLTLLLAPLEDALANRHGILPMGAAASLAVSHRNAARLLRLVNALLDFSRLEAGRAQASFEPVDLPALTADLASNFRSLCEKAGLQLEVDCPPLPAGQRAYVDRDMWEKIVLNLLSNAFKFTIHGGIEMGLAAQDGKAVLTVRDTGIGIPSKELPRMFERFHRIEHSGGRTHEGTGIGLALVHELTKLHGGTVSVESIAGKGSTFTVGIPLGSAHLDPHQVVSAPVASNPITSAAFVEEAMRWLPDAPTQTPEVPGLYSRTTYEIGPAAAPEKPPRAGEPVRAGGKEAYILWADDNADMRAYVARLLSTRFEVEVAPDGIVALALARARKPDLVLSDVMMPGLDGFGLLRELRADEQLAPVPVILLSARAGDEARIEGLQAGADDYLTKPFGSRELFALVDFHLKLSRARQEALEALKQADRNARLLVSIVESSDDAIISKDLNGTITSWNKSAERLFGYSEAEAVGQSVTMLMPPDRLEEEPRILASLRRGERVDHFETVRVRKDGAQLNISLTVSPVKDGEGRIVGASKVARDVTERVRQDAALKLALGDLEQFAYSASHDLREPLRIVTSYCQLLEHNFRDKLGASGEEFIRYIVDGAKRMDTLLQDLTTYTLVSAPDQEPPEHIDSGEIVAKALQNLDAAIKETGAIVTYDNLPKIRMRAFQQEQVFQNLIENAIRYRATDPPRIQISAVMRDKEWLFKVRDNGIGIPREFHQQIFGVFKRLHTRNEYPGTGMGLAICRRSVERVGGEIWVESELGKGSTFYFTVPRTP